MSVAELLGDDVSALIGRLAASDRRRAGNDARLEHRQTQAWERQVDFLRATFSSPQLAAAGAWRVVFEFDIPRRGKRIDVIVLADGFIAVIEFKTGSTGNVSAAARQAEDYVAELADFHAGSRDRMLVPIVVAASESSRSSVATCSTPDAMAGELAALSERSAGWPTIEAESWVAAAYAPTPTIIEAARHLYANHSVAELARSEAEAGNLTHTQDALARAIGDARRERRKIACFVTGVPGAGKTLAGLNAAVAANHGGGAVAVYLSGNGPLVTVLGEALAVDEAARSRVSREAARRRSGQFVQNVHRFINHYLHEGTLPVEHVVVFDEAQRAWDAAQAKRKYDRDESEPASMLRIMDRHDWAVLIALVGGGQEINTGEAGLAEWGRTVEDGYPHWEARVSPLLLHGEQDAIGQTLFARPPDRARAVEDSSLHLDVPLRSFRSTAVARWADALLAGDLEAARDALPPTDRFPIYLTRSLADARAFLRSTTRGLRRAGLVASSSAKRLRPHGVDADNEIDVAKWFLAGHDDVRSSDYLELVATEFAVQGLEVDRACVCWDADFRREGEKWTPYRFLGTQWQRVRDVTRRQFAINKYRVLLTRAREGMILWVPDGDELDPTRPPARYDAIADALLRAGVPKWIPTSG